MNPFKLSFLSVAAGAVVTAPFLLLAQDDAASAQGPIIQVRVYPAQLQAAFGEEKLKDISHSTDNGEYEAEQAVGAPNVKGVLDSENAWCPNQRDSGVEWLELEYAQAVEPAKVHLVENWNPGAVVKITGQTAEGIEMTLWEGEDPKTAGLDDHTFDVSVTSPVKKLRIHLDTAKVPGWNEIDAVELIGRDGSRQWAKSAAASSGYDEWNYFLSGTDSLDIGLLNQRQFYFELHCKPGFDWTKRVFDREWQKFGSTAKQIGGAWAIDMSSEKGSKRTFAAKDLLPPIGNSGDHVKVNPSSTAHSGELVMHSANAIGDFVTFKLPNVHAGNYSVRVRLQKGSSAGITQVMLGKLDGSLKDFGAPIDLYSETPSVEEFVVAEWRPGTTSDKQISLKIVGKNSASSGFHQAIDEIILKPVPKHDWLASPAPDRFVFGTDEKTIEYALTHATTNHPGWKGSGDRRFLEAMIDWKRLSQQMEAGGNLIDTPMFHVSGRGEMKDSSGRELLGVIQDLRFDLSGGLDVMQLKASAELADALTARRAQQILAGITAAGSLAISNKPGTIAWDEHTAFSSKDKTVEATVTLDASDLAKLPISFGSEEKKAAPNSGAAPSPAVTFFEHANYEGAVSQPLEPGEYSLAQLEAKGMRNHTASACKIPAGWKVLIYQNDQFGDPCWTLTSDTPDFGKISGLNDSMASCKIIKN